MQPKSPNLFVHSDGSLWNERRKRAVRERYAGHFAPARRGAPECTTLDVRATLRAGPYTSWGSYALAFLTSDGTTLCFTCTRENYASVVQSMRESWNDGWRIVGLICEADTEDECTCDHCNAVIWAGRTVYECGQCGIEHQTEEDAHNCAHTGEGT